MVNQKIQDRLAALRAVMKENGVDWYMVPMNLIIKGKHKKTLIFPVLSGDSVFYSDS